MPRSKAGLGALVLMAGRGTRLKSERAKVLHAVLGRPMGAYVVDALRDAGVGERVLVIGHQAELVAQAFPGERTALQKIQNGTGHAVKAGLKALDASATTVIVVNGDSPLLTADSIAMLLKAHAKRKAACTLAVTVPEVPSGLGRVFLDEKSNVTDMVEDRDCDPIQALCSTVNAGLYIFDRLLLEKYLKKISTKNAQGEEYLTDVPKLMVRDGLIVAAVEDASSFVVMPNTREELAMAALLLQQQVLDRLYESGVAIPEPDDVYIEPSVVIAPDATIWGGSYLRGNTRIAAGCTIGPNADLTDATIGAGALVRYSVVDNSTVGPGAKVGPYAHLRGGAVIGEGCRIGNFVEVKNSTLGKGAKASHLTYLGDATVGERSNVGAGTITCNYDGINKHPTTIGADVFIGSNSILVAPVTIGDRSMTAAGSVITDDVPPEHLAFGRARQVNKNGRVLQALKARQRKGAPK